MKLPYYPGCTLKDRTSQLESAALASAEKLGIQLEEVPNWTCCGAVYPVSETRIMNLVAPFRILMEVQQAGGDQLVTICDFCYNVLKRTNVAITKDPLKRRRLNDFFQDDDRRWAPSGKEVGENRGYDGGVAVLHYLEMLRDQLGFETMAKAVQRPLGDIKLAPYYGCNLLRPSEEMNFDDPENPRIMEDFLEHLGAHVVGFPYRIECCGSFLGLSSPQAARRLSHTIVQSARKNGADAIVLSCPMCFYNLETKQKEFGKHFPGFQSMPVLFFTQVLALALGLAPSSLGFHKHFTDPVPLLQERGVAIS
jgi:heterodisulfide reductase subunit B